MKKNMAVCAILLVLTVCMSAGALHFRGEYLEKLGSIAENERFTAETLMQAQLRAEKADRLDKSEAEKYESDTLELCAQTEELKHELAGLYGERADASANLEALHKEYAYYEEMYKKLSEGVHVVEDALAENS